MWTTFFGNVAVTIPLFWKAYQFSEHVPGSRLDADFWFLIQSCATQLVSLMVAGVGMWLQQPMSPWAWLPPVVLAAICTVLAVPLYTSVPAEWSALLTVFAGAIQSFLVLQLAIVGK